MIGCRSSCAPCVRATPVRAEGRHACGEQIIREYARHSAPFGLAGKLAAGTLAAERLFGRSGDAMRVPGSMQPTFIKVLGAHEAAGAQKCAKKEATCMPRAGLCAGGEQRAPCADGLEAAQGAALGFPTLRCARPRRRSLRRRKDRRRGSEPPPVPNYPPTGNGRKITRSVYRSGALRSRSSTASITGSLPWLTVFRVRVEGTPARVSAAPSPRAE